LKIKSLTYENQTIKQITEFYTHKNPINLRLKEKDTHILLLKEIGIFAKLSPSTLIMRLFFLALTITLLTFSSCKREELEFQSVGVITGPDNRMCPCCGGWFIEIDENTYRFDKIPDVNDIDLQSETFPLSVKLNYTVEGCGCLGDEVVIGNMVKN
jgi:hypothetical protein